MKKSYWVMKNPGNTTEWIELNGKQFYELVTSPDGKGRYFMDCETYKIEVLPEQYRLWKLEANRRSYLQRFEDEVLLLSFESLIESGGMAEYEADLSADIEDEMIHEFELQQLSIAIELLTDDERWLITELFLRKKPKTMREITKLTGIPFQTIHFRKNKILKKLKDLLDKGKKSQQ